MSSRIEKYTAKLSGERRKQLIDIQKDEMCRKEAQANRDFEKMELEVKEMVQGTSILHLPYYMIFAKELYRLKGSHKGETLINEMDILQEKWRARGLDIFTLDTIKHFYVETYPIFNYFIMDSSLLDGQDRLG